MIFKKKRSKKVMSKKFNFEDYKGKYVMCCKTVEEAEDFCRVMHEAGRSWSSGESYLNNTHWPIIASVCYNFNLDTRGSVDYYLIHGYKILYWSDFMDKEFTKDDLKTGDVVLRRNGDVEIFMSEVKNGSFIDKLRGFGGIEFIEDDLTGVSHCRDIMAVRRPNELSDMSFDAFEKKLGRLVYERDETVEMTLEEICEALGKNVKIVKGDK